MGIWFTRVYYFVRMRCVFRILLEETVFERLIFLLLAFLSFRFFTLENKRHRLPPYEILEFSWTALITLWYGRSPSLSHLCLELVRIRRIERCGVLLLRR